MQEFFYTILAIWVIWRIFGAISRSNERKSASTFTQTNNNYYNTPPAGDVRIEKTQKSKTPKDAKDDEYVDFEEIK